VVCQGQGSGQLANRTVLLLWLSTISNVDTSCKIKPQK